MLQVVPSPETIKKIIKYNFNFYFPINFIFLLKLIFSQTVIAINFPIHFFNEFYPNQKKTKIFGIFGEETKRNHE